MYNNFYKIIKFSSLLNIKLLAIVLFTTLFSNFAFASVVVTGNRIIYSASATEKVIQFTNSDQSPYMIQLWTDINNPESTAETADGPFVANPQMFRMPPNSGQAVRLMYTGKTALPTDRESVFYFNFLQIPSLKQADADKNKLALLITNRLKIFYRPSGLSGSPEKVAENLTFVLKNKEIEVTNRSAYHASFTEATIVDKAGKTLMAIPKAIMVAPKSTVKWDLPQSPKRTDLYIQYALVNDYGVPEKHQQRFD